MHLFLHTNSLRTCKKKKKKKKKRRRISQEHQKKKTTTTKEKKWGVALRTEKTTHIFQSLKKSNLSKVRIGILTEKHFGGRERARGGWEEEEEEEEEEEAGSYCRYFIKFLLFFK